MTGAIRLTITGMVSGDGNELIVVVFGVSVVYGDCSPGIISIKSNSNIPTL